MTDNIITLTTAQADILNTLRDDISGAIEKLFDDIYEMKGDAEAAIADIDDDNSGELMERLDDLVLSDFVADGDAYALFDNLNVTEGETV